MDDLEKLSRDIDHNVSSLAMRIIRAELKDSEINKLAASIDTYRSAVKNRIGQLQEIAAGHDVTVLNQVTLERDMAISRSEKYRLARIIAERISDKATDHIKALRNERDQYIGEAFVLRQRVDEFDVVDADFDSVPMFVCPKCLAERYCYK